MAVTKASHSNQPAGTAAAAAEITAAVGMTAADGLEPEERADRMEEVGRRRAFPPPLDRMSEENLVRLIAPATDTADAKLDIVQIVVVVVLFWDRAWEALS